MHIRSASKIVALCLLMLPAHIAASDTLGGTHVSTFGTPGLIDMPSGFVLPDGAIHNTTALHDGTFRHTLTFQITPRLFGSFRYSIIDRLDGPNSTRYDRSFDLGYLLFKETRTRPAVQIGLRDFGGTGVYGSEYVAASKHFLSGRLTLTAGLGWGRLASHGGFKNPLSILSSGFDTRGEGPGSISEVGRLEVDQWFRGDAALFGGLSYQVTPNLHFNAEYSSDAYVQEGSHTGFERNTPFNFGLTYQAGSGTNLTAFLLHGTEVGIAANFATDPKRDRIPSGIEAAPPALLPGKTAEELGWGPQDIAASRSKLALLLEDQGLRLDALTLESNTAILRISNSRYAAEAQAIGRAARILANSLPKSIEEFHIDLAIHGMPVSRVILRRQDLEELEYDLDGAWKSFALARIVNATDMSGATSPDRYPQLSWSLTPYLEPELFDPDAPIRADLGLQFLASYEPAPGLVLSGSLRQSLLGNLHTSTRPSNSVLPHVRTDVTEYSKQSDVQIKHLTAEYFFRPGRNLYARLTTGYFETMYGGVSGELLWKPVHSSLALGAEVNYARQRAYDQLFGFRDYDIMTGHASAYYDFGGGYLGQLDIGRYLAGDWGATVSLDREFNNGFRVGAFFTLTDTPFSQFGEGSFDKGIRFSIPIDWLVGSPSKEAFATTIRPVLRDGGARLEMRNRLNDLIRGAHGNELEDRWGRFWR
ncbi:YjbH domain-containing protein [Aliiroseovarius sp. KMU-50]|uniref:YjbH domain-containing protein n=1 Tax=Aliiroseovarius salicola TaxID=3009082 RepID=A0ABT4VXS4_9RHOB|nr:YjbH domain-containing protein [Aliiroseovarius sp. KMU-50]MDA5093065.1 YjbH domain-containing protein [Aliiroseovarius sp. KMU-50]